MSRCSARRARLKTAIRIRHRIARCPRLFHDRPLAVLDRDDRRVEGHAADDHRPFLRLLEHPVPFSARFIQHLGPTRPKKVRRVRGANVLRLIGGRTVGMICVAQPPSVGAALCAQDNKAEGGRATFSASLVLP